MGVNRDEPARRGLFIIITEFFKVSRPKSRKNARTARLVNRAVRIFPQGTPIARLCPAEPLARFGNFYPHRHAAFSRNG